VFKHNQTVYFLWSTPQAEEAIKINILFVGPRDTSFNKAAYGGKISFDLVPSRAYLEKLACITRIQ